jgi:hypothetical protein
MDCTRRGFLATMTGGIVAPLWPRAGATPSFAAAGVEPFPDSPLVEPFLRAAAGRRPAARIGAPSNRDAYLRLVEGIVRLFAPHQDARGAIVDPFTMGERQYSTPAFALAAAVLCASKRDPSILPACVRAMNAACADLAAGKAADRHADFFTVLLVHADVVLRPLVPQATAASWQRELAALVPEQVYVQQPASGRPLQNWNLVAAAGEFLRCREGYGRSEAWCHASLALQAEHMTAAGMYRDPNDPMAYDHFARLWALDVIEEGYRGPLAATWSEWLERAAWASLFMQSPRGELPCGGRSAHHQWNEAEQAVTFETFARRYARQGEHAAAGAFKRAARLSVESIARWVRPSGELWIVKNRVDPAKRHGYEVYSFHSQYNLLTAAMLALAWLRADEAVPDGVCPAELGGYAFAIQPAFHKVFAAAGGWSVEIDTGADLHYNPTGILRVHHASLPGALISDGTTATPAYTLPSVPTRTMAVGPEWLGPDNQWTGLASRGGGDIGAADVRLVERSGSRVVIEVVYRGALGGGATAVRETVAVSAGGVEISHAVEGAAGSVRQVIPVLVSDGETESTVQVEGPTASVSRERGTLRLTRLDGLEWQRAGEREPCRNGFLEALQATSPGPTARCRLGRG